MSEVKQEYKELEQKELSLFPDDFVAVLGTTKSAVKNSTTGHYSSRGVGYSSGNEYGGYNGKDNLPPNKTILFQNSLN